MKEYEREVMLNKPGEGLGRGREVIDFKNLES